jgi:hypothetical protein
MASGACDGTGRDDRHDEPKVEREPPRAARTAYCATFATPRWSQGRGP